MVIKEESKKARTSRSYIYKVLGERKTLYVSAATPDKAWVKRLKTEHKITIAAIHDFSKTAPKRNDYYYALNAKRMETCIGIKNRLLK